MNTVILIVVMTFHYGVTANNTVTFQEFNSLAQCQYAAKVIQDTALKVRSVQCVNK